VTNTALDVLRHRERTRNVACRTRQQTVHIPYRWRS
jgi:hypothetical protein